MFVHACVCVCVCACACACVCVHNNELNIVCACVCVCAVEKGNEDGLYISSVACCQDLWALIMDAGTDFTAQVYTLVQQFLPKVCVCVSTKMRNIACVCGCVSVLVCLLSFFLGVCCCMLGCRRRLHCPSKYPGAAVPAKDVCVCVCMCVCVAVCVGLWNEMQSGAYTTLCRCGSYIVHVGMFMIVNNCHGLCLGLARTVCMCHA